MKKEKAKRVRISQEDVPAFSLEEALRVPQAIFDNYGKQPTAPLRVAAAMKMAPGNAHFKMLCGAAIAYGLTVGGYNAASISLEPLAKRILSPTEETDDLKAKREAFLRPRVIKDFIDKYNNSPLPKEDIAINVLDDLGVPRDRAADVFKSIAESAERLGLVQEIKGKKYLLVDSPVTPKESNETVVERVEKGTETGVLPRAISELQPSVTSSGNGRSTWAAAARARRVFITHGKNKAFVDPIKKLLQFGELEAVVAIERQTVSEPVPDKVMTDMRSCGAAIIHVEGEMKLLDAAANEHIVLNPNVLIEVGAAMALYGKRFILLVKDGVKLPSNLQGLYCVRYAGENLDGDVTIKLLEAINELKKWPLIDAASEPKVVEQN